MITREIVLNMTAMIAAFIAMCYLGIVVSKIGGSIGMMLRFLILGIFLAVFVHAGFELATAFGFIDDSFSKTITAVLLTLGSVSFIAGGSIGARSF